MREFKSARIYRIWVREFKMREFKSARIITCANLTSVKVYGRRAFCFYAPRLWNILPMYLRQAPNINVFKKMLKTFLWQSFDDSY